MSFDIVGDTDPIVFNTRSIQACQNLFEDLLANHVLESYKLNRYSEGIAAGKKLLALNPKDAKAWHNLGLGLAFTRCYEAAIRCYQNAIDLKFEFLFDSYINQSCVLLMTGNMKRGLNGYEYRLNKFKPKPLVQSNKQTKLWKGESIAGKTLLVHHDGGFGDTIQFIRFLPSLKMLGCKILLFLQPELNCLFNHLNIPLITDVLSTYDYDVHVFMASLPYCLNTELSTIPSPIFIPARLRPINKRIGITWEGGNIIQGRKMHLQELLPILKVPNYQFVCLQKEVTHTERELLKVYGVARPEIESFSDTVKILEECEQVISIDTCVAHLSCSMGIPTYILLSYNACWKWLIDRQDSPWYPSATLLRQSKIDEWSHPIQILAQQLKQKA